MKGKIALLPLVAALGLGFTLPAAASGQPVPPPATARAPVWLGVVVGPVPEVVQAQLPEGVEPRQGLMIVRVVPGSPAAKAGLRRHDVLLGFNGDKLFTPGDLVGRVRNAPPGKPVELEVVRHGRLLKLQATLEPRQRPTRHAPPPAAGHGRQPAQKLQPQADARVWEQFQSLSVTKNPDGKYSAVVEYTDNGEKKRFEYEGTREEISAQVKKEQALPEAIRQQLLDALSDRLPELPQLPQMQIPPFPAFPDFEELERSLFAPPPWFDWPRQQGLRN